MKLGQLIDKVYEIFLENILNDFENWGLNPGSFSLKKVPQLIKNQIW